MTAPDPLRDRTVVLLGASAGVGRACVRAFAERGARLGLIARGRAGLHAAERDAKDHGAAAAVSIQADAADAEAVDDAAGRIEDELGPIDVWVNVVMTSVFAPVHEVTAAEFRRVTEVNYLGFVHGTLSALHRMRPRDRGTIVQVGSALAFRGIPLQAAYCASKHAIQGFHESLLTELAHDDSGVRASMVHLPAVNTPQFEWVRTRLPRHPQPVPPIFQPEVAAQAIVWAAEHAPRQLMVGASTVGTRYANVVAPKLLDWWLARSAYDDQQTDEPIDVCSWADNLEEPQDDERDAGAHGRYGEESSRRSAQLWATTHKPLVLAGLAAGVGAITAAIARR
jgi:NAD(P)-dependent dehydrogenase (short-subunit alcohol dehydrogenase family)